MDRILITIRHGEESRQIPLRKGLGLQALGPSCPRLEFDCRKADCGICIIMVQKGMESLSPPTAKEADFLRAMQALPSERLACQCRAFGDVEFEIENFD